MTKLIASDKKLGFGCMRLPMNDGEVEYEEFKLMIDDFISNGFNYFDTAHGYLGGRSEKAIAECLTSRYPRSKYILTDKLSTHFFKSEEDIIPLFESQLKACKVDYFDFYLMHAQDGAIYEKFKNCKAYETSLKLKEEGKIRHFGISFHDKADVLERILNDYPQIEVVQIQLNYLDFEDPSVESRKVYEVCENYGKPVIVMEPVKGGCLADLPDEASAVLDHLQTRKSNASYALRFAAGWPNVEMVLSGMSSRMQMQDNIASMKDFTPLSEEEKKALDEICRIFHSKDMIPCTSCHYCVLENECPKKIRIPELFSCYNQKKIFGNWNQDYYYSNILTRNAGKASNCLKCGKCEKVCPQHLEIRKLLENVAAEFEK